MIFYALEVAQFFLPERLRDFFGPSGYVIFLAQEVGHDFFSWPKKLYNFFWPERLRDIF